MAHLVFKKEHVSNVRKLNSNTRDKYKRSFTINVIQLIFNIILLIKVLWQ